MAEPVHARTGPGFDVAACGSRGHKLKFAISLKRVTCAECKVRRAATMDSLLKSRKTSAVEVAGAEFVARYSRTT